MDKPKHELKFAVLAADVALFTLKDGDLRALLIPVDRPPYFVNRKGLPGGLVDPKETAEESARRIISQKGGINAKDAYLEQLATFSKIDRDPRGRVVAVAYLGVIDPGHNSIREGADAFWQSVKNISKLAYDHDEIISVAVERLRSKLEYTNIVVHLVPEEFTLGELQAAYETILSHSLDKRNFRKKIFSLKLVKKTGHQKRGGASRPAELYSFTTRKHKIVEIL